MVVHVQPVAHFLAVAIERDGLFGELPGAVVVVPGVHQLITGRLSGRIGPARVVGGGLREVARGTQGTEHLVGTDLMKTKTRLALGAQTFPAGRILLYHTGGYRDRVRLLWVDEHFRDLDAYAALVAAWIRRQSPAGSICWHCCRPDCSLSLL